jgi:hypothetical protein
MRNEAYRSPAVVSPGLRGARVRRGSRAFAGSVVRSVSPDICWGWLLTFSLGCILTTGVAWGQRGDFSAPASTAATSVPATTAGGPTSTSAATATELPTSPTAATVEAAPEAVPTSPLPQPAAVPQVSEAEAAIREIEPEIYYLENEAGRLVPVPGFQYRDFVELLRLREGMPKLPTAPQAVLERLEMQVDVRPGASIEETPADEANQADASPPPAVSETTEGPGTLRIELTVVQAATGWVGLPLELSEALFTDPPNYETLEGSAGRFLLDADTAGSGYRGWFQGEPGTRHRVVLIGKLPVERTAGAVQLGLDVPRANASQLTVRSPLAAPEVAIEPVGVPPRVVAEADGGSTVSVVGLVGPTRVRLSSERTLREPLAAAPHASSDIVVTINGRQAKTSAVIELEHLPPGRRVLSLQLPSLAKLETLAAPTGLVALQGSDEAPLAVVSVDPDPAGRAVIELSCEAPVEPDGRSLAVLGFQITEIPIWRQWGQVSVVVEGDWQLDWSPEGPMRRVDPSLALRRQGCVAAFAFDAQPASLPLRVRPLRSRVVVEPEYRVRVAATRIELEARLRVAVRGAPISQFLVQLEGWELEDVGPAGLVDNTAILESDGSLEIPFLQGLSGDAVVEIRAARALSRDEERVEWTFPAPAADLVGPASVVILPESDIELTPDAEAIQGLVRQVSSPTTSRTADPLSPLLRTDGAGGAGRPESQAIAYRLDGPTGRFAASRRFLPRRVAASIATRLEVQSTEITVDEAVRFDVAYVPLEMVELLVPESVVASGTLEVRQGDRLLASQPSAGLGDAPDPDSITTPLSEGGAATGESPFSEEGDAATEPSSRIRVMLPVPLLGSGDLMIRYRLPATPPPAETTLAEDIPLVMPVGARFGKQTVALEAARGLAVEVRGESWKREMAVQGGSLPRSWASSRPQESIRLTIAAEPQSFGETVVDAAWLQSRFFPDQRQDLFRYRVATSVEQLEIDLPPGSLGEPADPSRVEVLLDGRPQADAVRTDGRIMVDLAAGGTVREYAVEVVVRRDRPAGQQPVVLEAPSFPSGAVERRFYWELRLSPDEHLLSYPKGWTAQQEWAWDTIGFLPRAIVSPAMLRKWVAPAALAPSGEPEEAMPYADRRLVFSGVGHPESNPVWIFPTWLLVLLCSGPMLLIGLLLVQWPLVRRPAVVMVLAILATGAAAVFPWRALLVLQAAAPGLLLSVLAAGLRLALRTPILFLDAAGRAGPVIVSQSSTRTALAAYVPDSSRGRRSPTEERSAS